MPPKRAASPAKKTSKQPTPPAQARASKRQPTPSTKSLEAAAAATGSTARAKTPSKRTATSPAMPTTRGKSPAKGAKSPKKTTSPVAETSPKRGRGRPRKAQPEHQMDDEDLGDVIQTTEKSPSRNKSPGKRTARGKSQSPARSVLPPRSPSQSSKKLSKTPVLSPKRKSSAVPTSPKAPASRKVQLHDEDGVMEYELHTYGNSGLEEEIPCTNNRNIVEPLGHDFPSHPSQVTPRSGTAAAASMRASPTAKRHARPPKQTQPAYDAEAEALAGPSARKPQQTAADKPLEPGQPSAPGRGPIRPVTNPEYIPDANGNPTDRKNPFFETMPAPEIWHRRMPPIFPFGETKRMEEIYSDQINEDLKRSK